MRRGDDNQERLRRRGLIKPLSVPLRRGRPCFPCEREWPRGNDLNKPSIRPSIAHLSPSPTTATDAERVGPNSEGRNAEGRKPNGNPRRETRATPNWIARSQTSGTGSELRRNTHLLTVSKSGDRSRSAILTLLIIASVSQKDRMIPVSPRRDIHAIIFLR